MGPQLQQSTPPCLPYELVDKILILLSHLPWQSRFAYRLAAFLRRPYLRKLIFPLLELPPMNYASSRGHVSALDLHLIRYADARPAPITYNWSSARRSCMSRVDSVLDHHAHEYTTVAMDSASENGHVAVLEWWRNSGLELRWTVHRSLGVSSSYGRVDVLEWWLKSGLQRHSWGIVFETAIRHGRIEVLEWWKCKELTFETPISLDVPSARGHLKVLEWCRACGMELCWTERAMDEASKAKHIDVLEWWRTCGLELKYSVDAMDGPSTAGYVNVLEWWRYSGLPLKYSGNAMDGASRNSDVKVLDWWKHFDLQKSISSTNTSDKENKKEFVHSRIIHWSKKTAMRSVLEMKQSEIEVSEDRKALGVVKLKYSAKTMDKASAKGDVKVLDWWKKSGLELRYTENAINEASRVGQVKSLKWWKASGLSLRYTEHAIDEASEMGHVEVLQWWKESRLELRYTDKAMDRASWKGHIRVLEWWKQSGLPLYFSPKTKYEGFSRVIEWWEQSGLD
ncbi:hypothetical protein BJ742DRAFT_129037 [Cladochytrium replicatum]|nr:hypothetical protein BJ742DRAFT_129037 [Cladochytrium replicatum]